MSPVLGLCSAPPPISLCCPRNWPGCSRQLWCELALAAPGEPKPGRKPSDGVCSLCCCCSELQQGKTCLGFSSSFSTFSGSQVTCSFCCRDWSLLCSSWISCLHFRGVLALTPFNALLEIPLLLVVMFPLHLTPEVMPGALSPLHFFFLQPEFWPWDICSSGCEGW